MKKRDQREVTHDLMAIGLARAIAEEVARGCCHKSGKDAHEFVLHHESLVNLTEEQEKRLLEVVLPEYERVVDGLVKAPLNANQRIALVSLVYNIGVRRFQTSQLLRRLNRRDYVGACEAFASWVRSGNKVSPGLVKRRRREMVIFSTPVPLALPSHSVPGG